MASTLNLLIDQGATFTQAVSVGTSFNGLTPRAVIRDSFGGSLIATLACSVVSAGSTTLSLAAVQTIAIARPASASARERESLLGVWELEIPNGATVTRTHQGEARLSLEAGA